MVDCEHPIESLDTKIRKDVTTSDVEVFRRVSRQNFVQTENASDNDRLERWLSLWFV